MHLHLFSVTWRAIFLSVVLIMTFFSFSDMYFKFGKIWRSGWCRDDRHVSFHGRLYSWHENGMIRKVSMFYGPNMEWPPYFTWFIPWSLCDHHVFHVFLFSKVSDQIFLNQFISYTIILVTWLALNGVASPKWRVIKSEQRIVQKGFKFPSLLTTK